MRHVQIVQMDQESNIQLIIHDIDIEAKTVVCAAYNQAEGEYVIPINTVNWVHNKAPNTGLIVLKDVCQIPDSTFVNLIEQRLEEGETFTF